MDNYGHKDHRIRPQECKFLINMLYSKYRYAFSLKEGSIKFILFFIYLFLAVLGLRCCTWASSSCGQRGLLFVVVRRLLIAVVSLVAEHGL